MSNSVDNRIVNMQFNNAAFERGIKQTNASLLGLQKNLNFEGAKGAVNGLHSLIDKFSFGHMAQGIDNIQKKFGVMGAIGFSVINNITNSALNFAKRIGGDFLAPLITGGIKRAHAIEQAKFQFEGLGLNVQQTMAAALKAVKGTAFGLDEAATAAASLGASGITVATGLTSTLRGIAGVAALTGSSYADIADVFQKVAGQGRLMGDDLNRLASRGVNAAAILAKSMHKTEPEIRAMVTAGKISFKEFSDAMDASFGKHATEASKTFTGALANMKAALARIGADVATPSFEGLRVIFNALTPVIDNVHAAIMPLITAFGQLSAATSNKLAKSLSGLDLTTLTKSMAPILAILKNLAMAAKSILGPIKAAFTEIFPPASSKQILGILRSVQLFTATLRLNSNTADGLKRTFAGVFAVLDIGWQVIKAILHVLGELFTSFQHGSGSILDFTGNIGDFLVSLDKAIKQGNGLTRFFEGLAKVIAAPIKIFALLIRGLAGVPGAFHKAFDALAPIVHNAFSEIGKDLSAGGGNSFGGILQVIQTGLLGGIALVISKFFNQGFTGLFKGGLISAIKGTFGQLTTTLKTLETQIKAKTLLEIAGAVGILTASIVVLSFINPAKLATAMAAITAGFGELLAAMAILVKVSGAAGFIKIPLIGAALIELGAAILVLSFAVKVLSTLSFEELAKGLGGVAVLLTAVALTAPLLSKASPQILAAGAAMIPLAVGLLILTRAVKAFGDMSWGEIGKGLAATAAALVAIALAMQLMPVTLPLTGAGLVLVGFGLKQVAEAMATFGGMKWSVIGKGLAAIAAVLVAIGLAMYAMPATLPVTAAGLILVGIALQGIAKALDKFAGMSWSEIGKGLATLAASLLILAVGLTAMTGTLAGSAALFVAASALAILAPVLKVLATMSWADIAKGMATIAAAFAVLGVAGLLLYPVIPAILALSLAVLAMGVAVGIAGAGIFLLSAGLAALTTTGAAGIPVLISLLTSLLNLLPLLAEKAAEFVVAFVTALATATPQLTTSIITMVSGMLVALATLIPKSIPVINAFIATVLSVLVTNIPKIAAAGYKIVIGVIQAMANAAPGVVKAVVNLAVNFIRALGQQAPRLATAAAKAIIDFINALSRAVDKNSAALGRAGGKLAASLVAGVIKGLGSAAIAAVSGAASKLAGAATGALHKVFHNPPFPSRVGIQLGYSLGYGVAQGISSANGITASKAKGLANSTVDALRSSIGSIGNLSDMNMDISPTIAPVLDLTKIKQDAPGINSLLNGSSIDTEVSLKNARAIATSQKNQAEAAAVTATDATVTATGPTFVQHNTSPEPLSTLAIYRNTKSLLSLAKEDLKV